MLSMLKLAMFAMLELPMTKATMVTPITIAASTTTTTPMNKMVNPVTSSRGGSTPS